MCRMHGVARAERLSVRLDTSLESLSHDASGDTGAGVLATLVATAGSTYRKPGARMLILSDGSFRGLLSGGCLEADLGAHAREVLGSGVARAVEYDLRGPDDVLFGLGAGCEGAMRVLLEAAGPGTVAAIALERARIPTARGQPTSLIVVHESSDLPLGTYHGESALPQALRAAALQALADAASREVQYETGGRRTRAFVQFLAPPPHLLVCGAGPDAQPVVDAAVTLGWRVTVVDHRPAYAIARRFPGASVRRVDARDLDSVVALAECHAAVVMSHHLNSDVAYLGALARTPTLEYVGLLGPKSRRERILQELGPAAQSLRLRIRGPVGIDIGAVTPEGIALAIISQVHAWLAGRMDRPG
jgi:xanthine dehydrogenase accessory factor